MATKITRKAVMRLRQCRLCGAEYESRHALKIFCDDCGRQREREADKLRAQRKARANGRRQIGQTYQCKVCGQDYILDWAPRKQCDPCSVSRVARWHAEKRSSDPAFSIATRMQRRMNECLGRGGKGGRNWENLVGYTVDQLVVHIERQFQRGMTWENRGAWHIDHIIPLSQFKITDTGCPEFKAAWALSNLRPLWAKENQRKKAKRLYLI